MKRIVSPVVLLSASLITPVGALSYRGIIPLEKKQYAQSFVDVPQSHLDFFAIDQNENIVFANATQNSMLNA